MFWTEWIKIWNGDFASVSDVVAEDFNVHATMMDGSESSALRGPKGLTGWISELRATFGDLTIETVVGPISDGNHAAGHWKATGTYLGGIPGATVPVGTQFSFNGTDVLRLEGGKAVEYWLVSDTMALFNALGIGTAAVQAA